MKVYVHQGFAFVPQPEFFVIILNVFRSKLSHALVVSLVAVYTCITTTTTVESRRSLSASVGTSVTSRFVGHSLGTSVRQLQQQRPSRVVGHSVGGSSTVSDVHVAHFLEMLHYVGHSAGTSVTSRFVGHSLGTSVRQLRQQ